ncbi:uncharacterized protein LOC136028021 isoform X4 [Artemia franciscana]|uniref:uncharacterized protein LOC136028021 isoform X4 n=1 Tax=Artemia franciscana TaxID=6661 RepID=UPI0032DA2557
MVYKYRKTHLSLEGCWPLWMMFVEGDKSSDWRKPLSDKLDDIYEFNSCYNKLLAENGLEDGDDGDEEENMADCFVEGDKSSDWRKPLSDKLDDIYEFNSSYNKLLAENGMEGGDDGDEEENMSDCDVESDVSSEKNSEFMPRTNTQQSSPGPINPIKRRAAFLQKYGPHSSNNSPPSDNIEEETFCLLKSVDGKGVKSKKVRIRASHGSIATSNVKQAVTQLSQGSVKSECLKKGSENVTASKNRKQSKDFVLIPMPPPPLTPKSAARNHRQRKPSLNVKSSSASPSLKPKAVVSIVQKKSVQLVDYSDTEMSVVSFTSRDTSSSNSRSSMSGRRRRKSCIPSSLRKRTIKYNSGDGNSSMSSVNSLFRNKMMNKGSKKIADPLTVTEKTDLNKNIKTKNFVGFSTDDNESGKTNVLHSVELVDEETESQRSRCTAENVLLGKENENETAIQSRTNLTECHTDKIEDSATLRSFSKTAGYSKQRNNEVFNLKESFTVIDNRANEIPKILASTKRINGKVSCNNIIDENDATCNIEDKSSKNKNQSGDYVRSDNSIVSSSKSKVSRTRFSKRSANNLDLTNIIPDIPSQDNSNLSSERRVTRSIRKNFDNIRRVSDIHKEDISETVTNISPDKQTTVIEKRRLIVGISEAPVSAQNNGKCKEFPICSTEDRSCNSMISKQKGKDKSRDSFQAKENGDEAVKTPSGLWKVNENKGSVLENRDAEDNDIKKRHVRKECSSSEVTVSVNSETGAVSLSQKYKRVTSVLKLKDDSTSVKGRELNDVLSLLDETILSDSSGKRITRSRLRATCTPVAALKPSSLSLSTSASLFPNETSSQSADSISVLSEAPTQIFTSVNPRKVNNKGGLTNMSECAKNGAVRTTSSTPNGVVPPQPQELSDLFSPIQSGSKNLGAAIQSNSVKVNDEANSNQLFTPQNFENCVRQAVTLILSTFIPNLAASQGQPNTEQRPASNAESLNAQQQQISSSNLAWSNLLLQNPFFTPGSISNLLSGSGLVHQPTPSLPTTLLPSIVTQGETNKKEEPISSSAKQIKEAEESPEKNGTPAYTQSLAKKKKLSHSPLPVITKKRNHAKDKGGSSLIHNKGSLQKLREEKKPQTHAAHRLRPAAVTKQTPEIGRSPVLNRKQVKLFDPENSLADLLKKRSNSLLKKKRTVSASPTYVSGSKKKNLNITSPQLYENNIKEDGQIHTRNQDLSSDVDASKLRRNSDKEKSLSVVRNKPTDQSILDTINRFKQPLDVVKYDGVPHNQSLAKTATEKRPFSPTVIAKKNLQRQKVSCVNRQDDLESPILSYNASDDNSVTLRSKGSAIVRKKAGENPQFRTPTLKKKSLSLKVSSESPQEKIHLKSPIMGSNAFGDDSGALRSRELTLVRNKSAGTLQLEVPIVEKRSLSSKVSNESQQTSPILSSNVSSDNMSLRSRRSVLKRGKSINKKKPLAPKTVNETGQVDLESSLFTSKYDYTPQRSGERSLPKEATAEKFQFRTPIAQKKTLTPKSTKKSMDDDLEGPIPNTNASEEENKSPKSRRLTTPRKCVSCSDCSSETPRQAFKDSSQFSKATKRKLWEPIESTSESGGKKIHRKRSRLVAPNLIKSSKINKNISRHHFRKQKEILKSKKKFENPKLSLRSQFPGESKQSASGTRKAKVSEERNKKAHLRDTRTTMDDLRFKTFSSRIRDLSAKTERQPLRNLSGLPSSIANALRESDSDDDDEGADFLLHL